MKTAMFLFGLLDGPTKSLVGEKTPVFDGFVDPDAVEQDPPAGAEMEMAGLGIADRARRHSHGLAG
jgi:hypothetical protein